jgi:Protein of unknown function (DUF3300)/Domain of unknown function (DUF4136)
MLEERKNSEEAKMTRSSFKSTTTRIMAALITTGFLLLLITSVNVMAETKSDFEKDFNFSKLTKWDFKQHNRMPRDPLGSNPIWNKRIETALETALERKGYERVATGHPDFLVTFYMGVKEEYDARVIPYGFPGGWRRWGWGGGVDVFNIPHTESTLVVDIIDAQTNQLVWRGYDNETIDYNKSEKTIQKSVEKLVERFSKETRKITQQIPDAAQWADQHSYLIGENLARAITEDNLPWDPSVLALLPFPSVLDMMATKVFWTRQLGDAVLGQRADVMDAVQRMRQKARDLGYLQDWPQYRVMVSGPGIIEIVPVDPAFYFVPIYDPLIVFARPRISSAVGITFGPCIAVGRAFAPWGWGVSGFGWASRTIILDGHPWLRTRENHEIYSHPYTAPRPQAGPRVERHELRPTHPNRHEGHQGGER